MNILLVEDNRADAHLLAEFLSEKEGAPSMHWVTDGYQALDFVFQRNLHRNAHAPDMIILDLGLPRVSGYEVLKQLKEDKKYAHIPIVILSTSCNPLDRNQCKSMGADAYFSKPHSLKGYESLVQELTQFKMAS
jgi:two-component system, chemotaxis family, response regulator Rcp1